MSDTDSTSSSSNIQPEPSIIDSSTTESTESGSAAAEPIAAEPSETIVPAQVTPASEITNPVALEPASTDNVEPGPAASKPVVLTAAIANPAGTETEVTITTATRVEPTVSVVASVSNLPTTGPQATNQSSPLQPPPADQPPPPLPPTDLKAASTDARVKLTWQPAIGAKSYRVKRSLQPGGPYTAITQISTLKYADRCPTRHDTYYYVVTAVNGNTESGNSNEASGKLTDPLKARYAPAIALVLLVLALIYLPDWVSRHVTDDEPAKLQLQARPLNPWRDSRIESISEDKTTIQIQKSPGGNSEGDKRTLRAQSDAMKSALKTGYSQGDRVSVTFDEGTNELQSLQVVQYHVSAPGRVTTLIIVGLILACIYWLLLAGNFVMLIIGADNRYSNSLFQMVVWFSIMMITYVSVLWLRGTCGGTDFAGGVNIPQHLLILSGLSALTFAGAKSITASKADKDNAKSPNPGDPSFPRDLFNDDSGHFDMADFQTVIITLLAVVVYLVQTYGFLDLVELHKTVTLLDVDTTILAVFGIGQGAYLAKKQVGDAGAGSTTGSNQAVAS